MNADRLILRWLTTQLASYLGVPASTIDPMVALHDMGVDSMLAISFVDDVEERFDINVDLAMVVFDYPTLSTIAELIETAIAGEQKQAA
jgi:acyl carrier protein